MLLFWMIFWNTNSRLNICHFSYNYPEKAESALAIAVEILFYVSSSEFAKQICIENIKKIVTESATLRSLNEVE